MTDKVQKIRAEIERLYNQSLEDENRQADRGLECAANVSYGKSKACKELLSFIDSMQEEPTIPDIVDEHWWEMLGEEPANEDLEKEIEIYMGTNLECHSDALRYPIESWGIKIARHFAAWQKEQDKQWLAENHKHIFAKGRDSMKQQILDSNTTLQRTFELGKQEMKQQMMKEAVNGTFSFGELADGTPIDSIFVLDKEARSKYKEGEKVKLLIIKEE